WHEFCDWYLELIKARLYGGDPLRKQSARNHLLQVLEESLRLLHPIMPFLTEEIYHHLPEHGESIMTAPFPSVYGEREDRPVEDEMNALMDAITLIRNIRGEMNIAPGKDLRPLIRARDEKTFQVLTQHKSYICSLARCSEATVGIDLVRPSSSAMAVSDRVEIFVPLGGVIDLEEERSRLLKNLKKVEEEITFVSRKLANDAFTSRAPANVVDKERKKMTDLAMKKEKIEAGLTALS
ncbi:MAG: class I tRNA ligase family protein, partial [bacterium]|nr:class I tRNA ligase family protein [bacterium]